MTTPTPQGRTPHGYANPESDATLRHRWLEKYILVQAGADKKIKQVLTEASIDAYNRIILLDSNGTFSARVRQAQIRMVMNEVRTVTKEIFGEVLQIVKSGQKAQAVQAVNAFAETDKKYLEAVFSETHNKQSVSDFLDGQRTQSQLQIAHVISRITKSEIPLSQRVYRSESLSNNWVQRAVNSSILRGDSARNIAETVRSHIKPTVPGGVSYAALRLGRTELNNAFHATTVAIAEDRPWVNTMQWHLSGTHVPQNCLCERYARLGEFAVEHVPGKPHPQCRCYVTPTLIPLASFTDHLLAGYYRDWTDKNV